MKKHIVSILCLILVATMVVACGGNATSDVSSDSAVSSETSGVVSVSSEVSSVVESDVSSNGSVSSNVSVSSSSSVSSNGSVSSNVSEDLTPPYEEPGEGEDLDPNQQIDKTIEERDDGAAPKTKVVNGKTYNLTFEDTFKGYELDSSKWVLSPEAQGANKSDGLDESMVEIRDGALVLWGDVDADGAPIGSEIITRGKWSQAYGYFEASVKLPKPPKCFNCAFWMMCGNDSSPLYGGKNGVEIDIFETIPNRWFQVQHNLHWDGYGEYHKSLGAKYVGSNMNLYDGNWHTYAVEWTDTYYKFYIDDQCTLTVDENHKSWEALQGTCIYDGYMRLGMAFDKSNGYNSVQKSHLPVYMLVDWVRAYK